MLDFLNSFFNETNSTIIVFSLQFLSCVFAVIILKSDFKRNINEIINNFKKVWLIPLFVVSDLLLQIVIQNFLSASSTNQSGIESGVRTSGPIGVVLIFFISVFVGPIMEEITFQYLIQKVILKYNLNKIIKNKMITSILSILVTTFLFMLIHVSELKYIYDIFFLGYLGVILYAIVYQITDDNLIYPYIFVLI